MKNIFLIKLRYIGDVVLSTPLLPILRNHFPKAHITFLVNPGTTEVLKHNPYVDEVWALPSQSWWQQLQFMRKVRKRNFDVVLDLTDGDRSAFLAWVTGSPVRLGYNRDQRWRGKLYSKVLPSDYGSMHMVDYHQQVLAGLGIHEPVGEPKVFVDSEVTSENEKVDSLFPGNGQRFVLLHPAARYEFKAWPIERFAALADWLSEQGLRVALIGSSQDILLGQKILDLAKHSPINLIGTTRLSQLAALMKRSALFVGNDGGPMHMASAVGCPVVGLFGPSDPSVWGPRAANVKVIYKGLNCEECFYPGCSRGEESCMRQISVEEVCQAVQSML